MTARDLAEILMQHPDAEVIIGICDDHYNAAGGVFVGADEVDVFDGRYVQITAWATIANETGEDPG